MDQIILIGSIALWGLVHSWLASLQAKELGNRFFGASGMRLYRLAYNVFAVLSFGPILLLIVQGPNPVLYRAPAPWVLPMLAGQSVSALLALAGLLQTGLLSFAGLRQLTEPEAPSTGLITGGLYRWVRHPLYLFGLLFLWLTPIMTVKLLTVDLSLTLYIFIGIYFEERKLLKQLGTAYAEYRARTPMIIPGLIFRRSR